RIARVIHPVGGTRFAGAGTRAARHGARKAGDLVHRAWHRSRTTSDGAVQDWRRAGLCGGAASDERDKAGREAKGGTAETANEWSHFAKIARPGVRRQRFADIDRRRNSLSKNRWRPSMTVQQIAPHVTRHVSRPADSDAPAAIRAR